MQRAAERVRAGTDDGGAARAWAARLLIAAAAAAPMTAWDGLGGSRAMAQATGPVRAVKVERPGELRLTTDRAVIFKDGHALIVKAAAGKADSQGRVFTEEVPESAVLGSFWAVTDGTGAPIRAMRAEWVQDVQNRTRTTACTTTVELLRANVGREVTLHMSWDGDGAGAAAYSGVIDAVLDLPPEETEPAPWPPLPAPVGNHWNPPPEPARPVLNEVREIVPRGGQFVSMLSTDPEIGRVVLPVGSVRNITGQGVVTTMSRREEVTTRTKRLTLELGEGAAGKPASLTLMYFTPGLRWIPTYRVSGELETAARIELQGELLNELEDLEGAAIDLVAGVPNFRFKGVVSPLSLEATLRNALVRAAPQVMGAQSQVSNAYFGRRSGEQFDGGGGAGAAPEDVEIGAAGEQDLYVYSVGKVSLPRGSRASVPLWTAEAALKHLYTMDLQIVRNAKNQISDYAAYDRQAWSGGAAAAGEGFQGGTNSPLKLAEHRVWHQLELTNTTKGPWTTGPALIMKGLLPLGQELLTYTPVKACALLPVTVAVDVRGDYKEEEIERTPNALRWENTSYTFAKIRKRATVTLVNYRDEAITTRVSLSIGGRVETASDDAEILINDFRSGDWGEQPYEARPSNHSDVAWEITLEPGETRVLTAEFFYYIR